MDKNQWHVYYLISFLSSEKPRFWEAENSPLWFKFICHPPSLSQINKASLRSQRSQNHKHHVFVSNSHLYRTRPICDNFPQGRSIGPWCEKPAKHPDWLTPDPWGCRPRPSYLSSHSKELEFHAAMPNVIGWVPTRPWAGLFLGGGNPIWYN